MEQDKESPQNQQAQQQQQQPAQTPATNEPQAQTKAPTDQNKPEKGSNPEKAIQIMQRRLREFTDGVNRRIDDLAQAIQSTPKPNDKLPEGEYVDGGAVEKRIQQEIQSIRGELDSIRRDARPGLSDDQVSQFSDALAQQHPELADRSREVIEAAVDMTAQFKRSNPSATTRQVEDFANAQLERLIVLARPANRADKNGDKKPDQAAQTAQPAAVIKTGAGPATGIDDRKPQFTSAEEARDWHLGRGSYRKPI